MVLAIKFFTDLRAQRKITNEHGSIQLYFDFYVDDNMVSPLKIVNVRNSQEWKDVAPDLAHCRRPFTLSFMVQRHPYQPHPLSIIIEKKET